MKFSAVDLFCGVGGLTHGIIQAGIPVVGGIDVDESCKFAYEANNNAPFIGADVSDLDSNAVRKMYRKGHIKILLGCAPCQPFSNYTNKNKERDKDGKWGLLYSFARLIRDIQPEVISMENVPQIQSEKVFLDFISELQTQGYYTSWQVAFCPDYGIPQIRKRLVLLASRLGKISLIAPTTLAGNYQSVREVIGGLEPIETGQASLTDPLHRCSSLSQLNLKRIRQSRPGGTWSDWDPDLVADCHGKESGESYMSVYGRMEWEKPSPTITTQFFGFGNGRFGHPVQDRALSLREGALLQTFPIDYNLIDPAEKKISIKKIGTQIGNAVPVKLGEVIGRSIIRHLKEWEKSARKRRVRKVQNDNEPERVASSRA